MHPDTQLLVYWLGKHGHDLHLRPSLDKPGQLAVTHAISGRHLLIAPPVLPYTNRWADVAGAAVNDWVREHGEDKAHRLLCDLAKPASRSDGIRAWLARLWARLFPTRAAAL